MVPLRLERHIPGAGLVFFAYIEASTRSRRPPKEAKNPQRDMPIGIIGIA